MDQTETDPTSGRATLNFYDHHRGSQQSSHSRMMVPSIQNLQSQLSKHEVRREIIAKDFLSKNIHAMSSQNISGLANNRPRSSVPMMHRNLNNIVQVNMNKDLDVESNADQSDTRTHQKRYFKSRLLRDQQHGALDFFAQQCDQMNSKLNKHQRANSNSLGTFDLQMLSKKQSTLGEDEHDRFKKKHVRVKFEGDNQGGRNVKEKLHKSNKLSQQLNDLSQLGKDLRILKKLSKQSKQDMRRIKNTKIVVPRGEDSSTINSHRQNQSKLQTMSRKNFQKKFYGKSNQLNSLSRQDRQSQCIFDLDLSDEDQTSQQSGQIDIFTHKNSDVNQLQAVKNGLKAIKGDNGFIRPQFAFECLNQIQKDADPKAYQCEMEHALDLKNQREKQILEQNEIKKQQELQRRQEEMQHEKALFDFDEEINDLDEVKDRYPVILATGQETKVDAPKDQEKEKQDKFANPVMKQYHVKKTERPALPQNILDDLNRIRQKQQMQQAINEQVIKNDLKEQNQKQVPPKIIVQQEDKVLDTEMSFKRASQQVKQPREFAPIEDPKDHQQTQLLSRPPLSSKRVASTTTNVHQNKKATMFEKQSRPSYTGKSSPRKEEKQVRNSTSQPRQDQLNFHHRDERTPNNDKELRLSTNSLSSQFQKPQLFSQKLLESIKRQYAVQPQQYLDKPQSAYYRPKKIKSTHEKKARQKSAVVGHRQSNYLQPQHRGQVNFINEAIQLSNNYMVPQSGSKGRFHFYNIKLDKHQAQFTKFKQQERPVVTAKGQRPHPIGGTTAYKFNY